MESNRAAQRRSGDRVGQRELGREMGSRKKEKGREV